MYSIGHFTNFLRYLANNLFQLPEFGSVIFCLFLLLLQLFLQFFIPNNQLIILLTDISNLIFQRINFIIFCYQ